MNNHPIRHGLVLRIPVEPEDYMPLVLARQCNTCLGVGGCGQPYARCEECLGYGVNLTDAGHTVLDLVQWFAYPPTEDPDGNA